MSALLDAARQALPGLEWTEIGPEVRAYIGQQLVYLTGRGSDGVFVYAGPDSHRWVPTIDAAASWLRAQVEARRAALDAALGESDRGTNAEKLAAIQARIPATYNGNLDAIFAHAAAYHGLGVTMVCAQTWEDGDDLSYEEQLALLIRQRDEVGEKLRALTGLVERFWMQRFHEDCQNSLSDGIPCDCGADKANAARAEARRLLGVEP